MWFMLGVGAFALAQLLLMALLTHGAATAVVRLLRSESVQSVADAGAVQPSASPHSPTLLRVAEL